MYHPGAYPQYAMAMPEEERRRLAPHETLELHELLAMKNVTLYNQKRTLPRITDPELKQICLESIRLCETHIRELVALLQYRE